MHEAPARDEEIVRAARIDEGAEAGGNDQSTRIAWAAGFLEGEGSIFITNGRGRGKVLRISAAQVDPAPIEELNRLFGGGVFRAKGRDGRRDHYRWYASNRRAADVLRAILPYMVSKRDQALIGLAFQEAKGPTGVMMTDEQVAREADQKQRLMELHHQSW